MYEVVLNFKSRMIKSLLSVAQIIDWSDHSLAVHSVVSLL